MLIRAALIFMFCFAGEGVAALRRSRRAASLKPPSDGVERILRSDAYVFIEWLVLGCVRWALVVAAVCVMLNGYATWVMYGSL